MTRKGRPRNPRPIMLGVRNAGEASTLISALRAARPASSGSGRSAIDRWCSQLQRLTPRPAEAAQNVFDLDGQPHVSVEKFDAVAQIFEHWRVTMKKPRARLDSRRRALVARRLADGYSVDELLAAIDGCAADAWSMGANDRGKAFNELSLILRDAEHIERFTEFAASPPRARSTATSTASLDAARAAWLKVLNHVRGGRYRSGAGVDDGGPIDAAVTKIGGYRYIGQSHASDLRFIERRFVECFSSGRPQVPAFGRRP